jgi:hypothetical protein
MMIADHSPRFMTAAVHFRGALPPADPARPDEPEPTLPSCSL